MVQSENNAEKLKIDLDIKIWFASSKLLECNELNFSWTKHLLVKSRTTLPLGKYITSIDGYSTDS
jgi:hypothetical protein